MNGWEQKQEINADPIIGHKKTKLSNHSHKYSINQNLKPYLLLHNLRGVVRKSFRQDEYSSLAEAGTEQD